MIMNLKTCSMDKLSVYMYTKGGGGYNEDKKNSLQNAAKFVNKAC